jgi:hypothetical protein
MAPELTFDPLTDSNELEEKTRRARARFWTDRRHSLVVFAGNKGWSLCGAPGLQPVAIGGKRGAPEDGANKPKHG